jgi:hypothetical protein
MGGRQFIPDANQDLTQTLIEHWDGTSVTAVSSPNVGNFANALFGVTAKGGLAWAVGTFDAANPRNKQLRHIQP